MSALSPRSLRPLARIARQGAGIALSLCCGAPAPAQSAAHRMLAPDEITWGPGRNGISSAVLDGNPSRAGEPYTLALKLTDGAWIRPHFHPNDKRVVVVSGTLLMGMGDSIVVAQARVMPAGSFVLVPRESHHYEGARGETVLFLYGIGPLTTTFVSAAAQRGRSSR